MFSIHMGVPEMEQFWKDLSSRVHNKTATKVDLDLYKKLGKCFHLLSCNPKHNSLKTHEIKALTERYGMKVWESYIENNTPGAKRLFWVYGPGLSEITIIGLETHPDNKNNSYKKIKLSNQ